MLSEERKKACQIVSDTLKGQRYEDVTAILQLAADCREHGPRQVYTDIAACLKKGM